MHIKEEKVVLIVPLLSINVLCFILPYPLGYSAYASQLLRIKENKSNANQSCQKVESNHLKLDEKKTVGLTESNREGEKKVIGVV
jgi:hypothetical protein